VIICSSSVERGQKALSDLQATSPASTVSMVQLDVTDQASINAAVAHVEKEFGRLDVLINNAGITYRSPNLLEQMRTIFETNTFGPAIVTELFLPLLEKSNDGRLIYVSSDLGSITLRSDPSAPYYKIPTVAYRMSKSALNMLMVCHHVELKERGIKVWAFNPGYVVTNLSGTGEAGIQERIRNGAGDASVSAKALVEIVAGTRDGDVGKHIDGEGVIPW
jgi:NAD(P)-dependent dehydrogenase (short-subunit alcohol dehydrogenase family)